MPPFPDPTGPPAPRAQVLLGYLDYFRGVLAEKVADLPEEDARTSRLPSGWSPLELVHHLVHVERRWLDWGFEGRDVGDPWADRRDGRWHVPEALSGADVLALLEERGRLTRAVVERHALDEVGAPSGRWEGADPPALERVLLHLLQEHARHAGHLDVVRELVDGRTGEDG
ncbi:DUF664 domain-containing protein [Vallicoccus soli]|uniref:DUF664 domain-containing protein n=1 Tax=Vallicoccus soli TaxID=2339232 RepID=A0A3A3YRB4_9ACTN|nr:DUF664 domain-containing protein [Vallicoccus soli]RJK92782.1 DUF664 domain-containing protein [Vallicoccus soli]